VGALDLIRSLPRGVRPPGPIIGERSQEDGFVLTQEMWDLGMNGAGGVPLSGTGWQPLTTATTVRGIPAAWYCNNLIAGVIAQMPLEDIDPETDEVQKPAPQVLTRPWPMVSYYDFIFMGITQALLNGNFYGIKYDYDDATLKPRQLLPVMHEDMHVEVIKGVPYYTVMSINRTFTWDEIFHVRGLMVPGRMTGIGVIEAHRLGLAHTRTLMDYGNNSYTGGAVPPVVIKVNKPELAEGEAEYLQSRWMQRHSAGNRIPAVVPGIVDVEQMGMSMVDSDYLNSRKFSIAEIAFMFGVNPEFLTVSLGGSHVTYANVETKNREQLIYTLQPWMNRFEQAYNDLLAGSRYSKFNADTLLRADEGDRIKMYAAGLDVGIFTLNDVRRRENLPTYDSWADEPFGVPPPPKVEPVSGIPQEATAQPATVPAPAMNGDAGAALDAQILTPAKA
jgi:HK97 family phage portal protein